MPLLDHYKINTRYIQISNLWINKNNKGDFNDTHVHPNSHFAGVYYVDASTKGGTLKFINDDTKVFANYWIHNAFITMSNEKMAKSQGNILKIKDT